MDIKKYEVPFTILIAALGFFEIIFLIKLIFSDAKGFEWGNVSDWFSAIFNGIVALTAIAALVKTNNYFNNKLTEENISLWLQINDNVSSIASSVTVLWILYQRMINQWQETDDIDILKYNYYNYTKYYNEFTAQLHKLDECNFRIETRTTPYAKKELLVTLTQELASFDRAIFYQTDKIVEVLKFSNASHPYPDDVKKRFIDSAKSNLSNPYILNEKLQATYSILREFGIDDHHSSLNTGSDS